MFRRALIAVLITGSIAAASPAQVQPSGDQLPSETSQPSVPPEFKNLRFDVVSIRRNKSGGPQVFAKPTADGFQMRNMFLAAAVLTAYVPTIGGARFYSDQQVVGMPAWLSSDEYHYDLDAKVAAADLPDWQNPAKQPAMLRAMLQNLLADRLHLQAHRTIKETKVLALVVAKGGPRFKEANPAAVPPGTFPMPAGGSLSIEKKEESTTVHYFGISMGQLITFVAGPAGHPIQDRTGLTGKFDITIVRPLPPAPGTPEASLPPENSPAYIANQLGLRLEQSQGQVETLVIDHIEPPTEN